MVLYAVIETAEGRRELIPLETIDDTLAFLILARESVIALTPSQELAEELAKRSRP